jgi:RHS repeat-associated protein
MDGFGQIRNERTASHYTNNVPVSPASNLPYIWGDPSFRLSEPELQLAPAGLRIVLSDYLGSPRVVMDHNGLVQERNTYYPSGLRIDALSSTPTGAPDVQDGWAGGRRAPAATDFYGQLHGRRFYDPAVVSWYAVEPLATKYASVSPYSYALGDPVNRRDPSGLAPEQSAYDIAMALFNATPSGGVTVWYPGEFKNEDGDYITQWSPYFANGGDDEVDMGTTLDEVVIASPPDAPSIVINLFDDGRQLWIDLAKGMAERMSHLTVRDAIEVAGYIPVIDRVAAVAEIGYAIYEGDEEALIYAGVGIIAGGAAGKLLKAGARLARVAKMANVRALGRLGEEAAGIAGRKRAIKVNGRTRIPDEIRGPNIKEVKNVKSQSLTTQIRDYADAARLQGGTFTLVVGQHTTLSKPLQDFAASGNVIVQRIPMPR